MTFSTLRRTGLLRQRSKKRVKEDAEFAPIRKACFERDGRCMAPLEWGRCWGPWTPHHIVPGGRDKTLRLVLSNVTTLCVGHHHYAHDHPVEATKRGLLKSASVGAPLGPKGAGN